MKHVAVPLADGFEETEAASVIDILRRAGLRVTIAGVGGQVITGSHEIRVGCDCEIEDCDSAEVLPGGHVDRVRRGAGPTPRLGRGGQRHNAPDCLRLTPAANRISRRNNAEPNPRFCFRSTSDYTVIRNVSI